MIEIISSRDLTDDEKQRIKLEQEIKQKQHELDELNKKSEQVKKKGTKQDIKNDEHDKIDELTPEEEKIVSEAIKYDPKKLELSDEEVEEIKKKTELEYKSMGPDIKINFKLLVVCSIIILVIITATNMARMNNSMSDYNINNATDNADITINVTDILDE